MKTRTAKSLIGVILVALLAPSAFATDGFVWGYLKTFDLRSYRCDDTLYDCASATKLQSTFNTLPAALRLKRVSVEVVIAGTENNICDREIYTSNSGYFRCDYRGVSGNPNVKLKVRWQDQYGFFKLVKLFPAANGLGRTADWITYWPDSHGGAPIRLNGGSQRLNPSSSSIVFYQDGSAVGSDDIEAANLYADSQLTFERIEAEGMGKGSFFDNLPGDSGRVVIGLDVSNIVFPDPNGVIGLCCYRWDLFSGETVENGVDQRAGILISDRIFDNGSSYYTGIVHHELGHLADLRAQIYYHDSGLRHNARADGVCPSIGGAVWDITSNAYAACYQPVEGLAEMFAAAVVYGKSAETGEARFPSQPSWWLEPNDCGCSHVPSPNSSTIYDAAKYFWDLYDTTSESGQNCRGENLSLPLWDVFRHASLVVFNAPNDGEGSLYRILDEVAGRVPTTCAGQNTSTNNSCLATNETGLFDMAYLAYDDTLNQDYIDNWRNNCRSPGDYTWKFRGLDKCLADCNNVSVPPSGHVEGIAEHIAQCRANCRK